MTVKLKVTDMVVGEIVFPVVEGRNLRANSTFVVDEEKFNHFTIQSAINKGFLTIIEDSNLQAEVEVEAEAEAEDNNICKDLNSEHRYAELNKNNIKTLKSMGKDLKVNRYSKLNKHDLIESIIEAEGSGKQDIKRTEEAEAETETETEDIFIDLDEMTENTETNDINPQKDGTPNNMGSWDAYKRSLLDKDASSQAVREQYNGVKQDFQTTQDDKNIDFSVRDDQENLDNAFDEIKKKVASASSLPKKKNGKKAPNKSKNSTSKGIKPVGEIREEISADDAFMIAEPTNDLNFVDIEQRSEAIRNHPVLGKKKEGNS